MIVFIDCMYTLALSSQTLTTPENLATSSVYTPVKTRFDTNSPSRYVTPLQCTVTLIVLKMGEYIYIRVHHEKESRC